VADEVEAELKRMAEDPEMPAHLKLGALKQLVALRGTGAPARGGEPVVLPEREDGLPPDPLLERFPEVLADEDGRPNLPDPMADLSWAGIVGRMPHALYARVLHTCPWHPNELAKAGRPRRRRRSSSTPRAGSCAKHGTRGSNTEADEVAEKRRRKQRDRRPS
jgi:hypothetical protein